MAIIESQTLIIKLSQNYHRVITILSILKAKNVDYTTTVAETDIHW